MMTTAEHRDPDTEEWLAISPLLVGDESVVVLTAQQAQLWALVLQARTIPCSVEPTDQGWCLLVPGSRFHQALHELRQYLRENRNWPPPLPAVRATAHNTLATLSVLLLLATFHNLTLLDISFNGQTTVDWLRIGAAKVDLIRQGEWWRTITALTLHANLPHLFSNLTIGGFIVLWLCRDLGSGLAWSLLLGSGILGNLLNAAVQPTSHSSVGASTVVFGAVGLLSASNLVRLQPQPRKRWGLPIAGGMALLAILGTEGERTDLGAHLFGCLAGFALGLGAAWLVERYGRPSRTFSLFLSVLCFGVVITAWWLALLLSGRLPA
jgi:membrane associated rhomboid family serine protease